MQKEVAIIGGGVVGMTAAYYLAKQTNIKVTLYDEGTGQGTKASAGIISPWLSKRRNQAWYEMVKLGAAFYPSFLEEVLEGDPIPERVYQQVGTLQFTHTEKTLDELLEIGLKRREEAPEIGELSILSPAEIKKKIPIYSKNKRALFAGGGARVDGKALVELLQETATSAGLAFVPERARLVHGEQRPWQIETEKMNAEFDAVILANAAWLPEMLEPFGYEVDIRPQKGQLVELDTDWQTDQWPVVMPAGEKDIIPFLEGNILVGATHEDEAGYDLTLENDTLKEMVKSAGVSFADALKSATIKGGRVGTRAYTSDYAPFFGEVPDLKNVYAASGLGATGLTSGPIVGKMLSDLVMGNEPALDPKNYPIEKYILGRD